MLAYIPIALVLLFLSAWSAWPTIQGWRAKKTPAGKAGDPISRDEAVAALMLLSDYAAQEGQPEVRRTFVSAFPGLMGEKP